MKHCIACGVEFIQKRIDQDSCGIKNCVKRAWKIKNRDKYNSWQRDYFHKKARLDWHPKNCKNCGVLFLPKLGNKNQQVHCTSRCREKHFSHSTKGRDLRNFHGRNRRHRIKALGGKITRSQWEDVLKKFNYRCAKCQTSVLDTKLTMDHCVPITKGGPHSVSNIQPLCVSCNSRKHTKIEFYPTGNTGQFTPTV